jgi:hypothetical protein
VRDSISSVAQKDFVYGYDERLLTRCNSEPRIYERTKDL